MRHVAVMTFTAALGLMSIFLVDLADMFFLSLLGEVELASAIGYAGSILFFTTSIAIAMAITMSALVARAIGANRTDLANRHINAVYLFAILVALPMSALVWYFVPTLLGWLGAHDRALDLATTYLRIVIPAMVLLMLGMTSSGVMRAVGQANKAMSITLIGAGVNLVLDPLLIFGLDMGVAGAATATMLARLAMAIIGLRMVFGSSHGVRAFKLQLSWRDLRLSLPAIRAIALPAMVTNIATPVGNAYVTATIAGFGDGAVAGYAIVARVLPVAFGVVFALSGAVGPIIGQNYGAGRLDRVRQTVRDAVLFGSGFVLMVALILFLAQSRIIAVFGVDGDAAMMIGFFCTYTAVMYLFDGAQFVANATFNNLNRATWSTAMNWSKATLGTFPFVWLGASLFGPQGALAGQSAGAALSGIVAIALALRLTNRLEREARPAASKATSKTADQLAAGNS